MRAGRNRFFISMDDQTSADGLGELALGQLRLRELGVILQEGKNLSVDAVESGPVLLFC